jgi:hypothetical protein
MSKTTIPKEYLGAFKRGHRHDAKEFVDEELSQKLLEKAEKGCEASKEALLWLTRFNNEYHKSVFRRADTTALHNTKALKKDCMDRSNQTRRDVYSKGLLLQFVECDPAVKPKDEDDKEPL